MLITELTAGQTFTASGYEDWGTLRFDGVQGNVALATVLSESKKAWLPNPNAPIWMPHTTEVTLV